MRTYFRTVLAFACLALAPAAVYAQATLSGTVTDGSGAILPGVTVDYVAADVRTVSVRGFADRFTSVSIDGMRTIIDCARISASYSSTTSTFSSASSVIARCHEMI